jgi:hypothetical protein
MLTKKILPKALMMALVFFVLFLVKGSGQNKTNIFQYEEGFENGGTIPAGWNEVFVSGDDVGWSFQNGDNYNASAYEGSYNALLSDTDDAEDKTRLISPAFDLDAYQQAQLTFWHIQDDASNIYQDELRVYCQTSGGGNWELLKTYTGPVSSWTQRTIYLSELSSTTKIAFEGNAKNGHGVGIDKVKMTAGNYSVSVFVNDSLDNHPITDASVLLGDSSETTGSGGEAIFNQIPDGENYVLRVEKQGYAIYHDTLDIVSNDSIYVKLLNADSAEYRVVFDVVHIDTGEPVDNASVNLSGYGNKNTNTQGKAVFNEVTAGEIDYTVSHTFFQDNRDSVLVSNDHVNEMVTMRPKIKHVVEFTVKRGSDQDAIEGAMVSLSDSVKSTNSQGKASFLFPDGTYQYVVSYDSYKEDSGSLTINGEDVAKTITLNPLSNQMKQYDLRIYPNPVRNYLVVRGNNNITGVKIQLIDARGQIIYSKKKESPVSVISMEGFPDGFYILKISKQKHTQKMKIIKE